MPRQDFPSREELLNLHGDFTWDFGKGFFIEVKEFSCNFVWSDPDYGGDNKIEPFCGSYEHWIKRQGIDFGRAKGYHQIERYCGNQVIYEPGLPE